MGKSIGLPRMHKEAGERRDFLPELVEFLDRIGAGAIVIEEGYGSGIGFTAEDYLARSRRCRIGSYEECLAQDVVLVLRYPTDEVLRCMRRASVLMSMIHFPTRPGRVQALQRLGLNAISLDGMVDDRGNRLVENLAAVGWNGIACGFRALRSSWPGLEQPRSEPVRVLLLGAGAVGAHAMRAAVAWGDRGWRAAQAARGQPGVEVTVIDYDLSSNASYMQGLLARSDLVADATLRRDASRPVLPNEWLAALPAHAVLVDLSVDPCDLDRTPPLVKGIEGIPEGNLDRYEFQPDDPAYQRIDPRIDTRNRRVALSCYSWPGIEPRECMEVYGKQIEPLLRVVLERPLEQLDLRVGTYFERAVARAELRRWQETQRA